MRDRGQNALETSIQIMGQSQQTDYLNSDVKRVRRSLAARTHGPAVHAHLLPSAFFLLQVEGSPLGALLEVEA